MTYDMNNGYALKEVHISKILSLMIFTANQKLHFKQIRIKYQSQELRGGYDQSCNNIFACKLPF